MFELHSISESVPLERESLTRVHRGMNKVRVSVGDHVSEPSEVYIVTGQNGEKLETYTIFYMLEPRIHVIYGFDGNPYGSGQAEDVIEEAVIFVEEMGSILEEVPWQDMTDDQKSAWLEKEPLYTLEEGERADEEDLQELETEDLLEEVETAPDGLEEGTLLSPDDEILDVVEDLEPELLEEEGSPEGGEEPSREEPSQSERRPAEMEDVVVAEGDFDALLKQAFLKPDLVEKTSRKVQKFLEEEEVEEDLSMEEEDLDLEEGEPGEMAASEAGPVAEEEAGLHETLPDDSAAPTVSRVGAAGVHDEGPPPTDLSNAGRAFPRRPTAGEPDQDPRLRIIRFLSRF